MVQLFSRGFITYILRTFESQMFLGRPIILMKQHDHPVIANTTTVAASATAAAHTTGNTLCIMAV